MPRKIIDPVYGEEPTWENVNLIKDSYNHLITTGLNWYNVMAKDAQKKAWAIEWAKKNDKDVDGLKRVPDQNLTTIGAMCRMIDRGFPIRYDTLIGINDRIQALTQQYKNNEPEVKQKPSKPQISERVMKVMDQFDEVLDKTLDGEPYTMPTLIEMSNANLNQLIKHYEHELEEGGLSEPIKKVYTEIIQECKENKIDMNKAIVRKPRKKRVLTNAEMVKKLNYKDVCNEYELSSIEPQTIIGAKLLIVFNTKTRQLQMYNAEDEGYGIHCKGSTLTNFDKLTSFSKIIRHPKKTLPNYMSGNRHKAKKDFSEIRASEKRLTGRINKDCILLKAFYK